MIDISHDGNDLVVTLTAAYPITGTRYALRWNCGSSWAAALLWRNLDDRMDAQLKSIREEAYRQGWKDAKAHRVKETWFSTTWK